MKTNYIWIITILTNVLVTSSNGERPKRHLRFIKRIIPNLFGYNTNRAIMKNYMNILYPVPNYQVPMKVMPDPYMNRNIYQELFPKIFMPSNMVMQPIINFRRPYIGAFNERNYNTIYPNFALSPVLRKMQGVTPVPNYSRAEVPPVRCYDINAKTCRKNVKGLALLTSSVPPLPVKNIQKNETLQPNGHTVEKKNEKFQSTNTPRISMSPVNNINPNNKDVIINNLQNLSKNNAHKKLNNNKSNEGTNYEMENIKYPKDVESQGDLMSQPSIFSHVIDMLNIDPIGGKVLNPPNIYIPQDVDDTLKEMDSNDMEVSNQSTDVYPSDTEELSYLNSSPVILYQPSIYHQNHTDQEEGSQNKRNEGEDFLRLFSPSNSATEMSRGDVPDVKR